MNSSSLFQFFILDGAFFPDQEACKLLRLQPLSHIDCSRDSVCRRSNFVKDVSIVGGARINLI
jgi:hypothetical protein